MLASVHRGGVEIIDQWAEKWHDLCNNAADDQPFYRPEWIAAHIRAYTPDAKVLLLTVNTEDRLCLLLTLLEERATFCGLPVRRLRAPANGHSVRVDAVRRRGHEGEAAIPILWRLLKNLPSWDLLEFEGAPTDGAVSILARSAEQEGFPTGQVKMSPNPYVQLPSDLTGLAHLPINKKLRSQLRGIRREFAETGAALKLTRICQADPNFLQRFYELESAGWKGEVGSAIACSAKNRKFYDEISRAAERLDYLTLYRLELDDKLLAAHWGLTYRGRYFSPKIAYDENLGRFAPGHLIVQEILHDCVERGIHEYDITGQNDAWKQKWTAQTRPQCVQYVFRKTAYGRFVNFIRFRIRPAVRRIVYLVRK
jgi:CelD/BcsL family acetyltransferase involved in cellulose biosynthesis